MISDARAATLAPILRGFFTLLFARTGAVLLQFVTFGVLAAHLGPRGFGIYAFAVSFAWLFRTLPAFGLDMLATRELAQRPEAENKLIPDIVFVRVVLAAASYMLLVGALVLGDYGIEEFQAALVAGITLFLHVIESFAVPLAVRMRFGWPGVATTVESGLLLLGTLILAANGAGVLPFLWLYCAVKLASVLIIAAAGLRVRAYSWQLRLRSWPTLVRAATPLAAAAVLATVYHRIDMALLARLKPESDVGQYGVAFRFYETALLIPALVGGVLHPVMAGSFVQPEGVFDRRYRRAMRAVFLATVPLALIGGMTAWRVLPLLPGLEDFDGAGVALSILSPAAAFAFVSIVVHVVLIGGHLQRVVLVVSAIAVVVNLVLIAILIPLFSFIGAAISATVTTVVVMALSVGAAWKRLGLTWRVERFREILVSTLVLGVVLVAGYALNPFLQVTLGATAYVAAAFATGALDIRDLTQLFARSEPRVPS